MLHDLFHWAQYEWGVEHSKYGSSFSQTLLESLNFWGVLEGTHLLTLMLFFGTILIVDMRLLGLTFKKVPVSVVSDRVLPLTVFSMIVVIITGVVLFFSKPEEYWHNLWFRTKMVLLVAAMINVYVMHKVIQKNQAEWDNAESPPSKAKISAIISLASWILIIACGRFIAYNWFECGKPQPDWVNSAQACGVSTKGAMTMEEGKSLHMENGPPAAAEPAPAAPPAGAADIFAQDPAPAPAGAAQPEAK